MKSKSDTLLIALLAAATVAVLVMAVHTTYIVHVEWKKRIELLETELEFYRAYTRYLTQYFKDDLEERIARLERTTRGEYYRIKREIARLEGQIRFLRDRYVELNERLLKLEGIVSKHHKRIRELSYRVEVLEFAVDRLLD